MMTEPNATPKKEFNFCFWSKLIVAIPALPIIGYVASAFFENGLAKGIAAITAVALAIFAAIKIDGMACFAGKVVKKQKNQ